MKLLLLLIACLLFVACTYDGRGTNCDQYKTWESKAKCYRDYSKRLEMEIEISKIKMEYECKAIKMEYECKAKEEGK